MGRRCATIAIVTDFAIDTGASARLTDVIGLGVLTRLIDRDTVDEVLAKADRRDPRLRLLPARVVVYLVLALCLFTADGYDEVVRKLTNGLRGLRIWRDDWTVPTASAISQARERSHGRLVPPGLRPGREKGRWTGHAAVHPQRPEPVPGDRLRAHGTDLTGQHPGEPVTSTSVVRCFGASDGSALSVLRRLGGPL